MCADAHSGSMRSTVIDTYAYDPGRATLEVCFLRGSRYRYYAVPRQVADALGRASSKGRFFNACIRDRYAFTELDS